MCCVRKNKKEKFNQNLPYSHFIPYLQSGSSTSDIRFTCRETYFSSWIDSLLPSWAQTLSCEGRAKCPDLRKPLSRCFYAPLPSSDDPFREQNPCFERWMTSGRGNSYWRRSAVNARRDFITSSNITPVNDDGTISSATTRFILSLYKELYNAWECSKYPLL